MYKVIKGENLEDSREEDDYEPDAENESFGSADTDDAKKIN